MTNHEIEIWIAMNENGDATAGVEGDESESDVSGRLVDNYESTRFRIVKLKVRMSAPQVAEVEVNIPDEVTTEAAK